LRPSGCRAADRAAGQELATSHFAEEEKMAAPKCPPTEDFPVITGFVTPASDFAPPHPLDASVTVDVFDPTEIIGGARERIRVVETDTPFDIDVEWCLCGALAASISGCWQLRVYLDDIDGGDPRTVGLLTQAVVDVSSVPATSPTDPDDVTRRCYKHTFSIPANRVIAGVYNLVVVITLRSGSCRDDPQGAQLGDWLGFAEIPVLVFVPE
jgi:hypothetical protein